MNSRSPQSTKTDLKAAPGPLSDLSRTAFSLSLGAGFVGFAAWHGHAHPLIWGLALSLPLGVVLFWTLYQIESRPKRTSPRPRPEIRGRAPAPKIAPIHFGLGLHDNPIAPAPSSRVERRVLNTTDITRNKERLLQGREPVNEETALYIRDQWHD